ncbi:MAG: hypothetical protein K0R02_535 [Rickettsiaceae bacterium]|jgi:uncharacterized protein YcfL|nr:hypothetical protein [Rickettsiaceae bacterium]
MITFKTIGCDILIATVDGVSVITTTNINPTLQGWSAISLESGTVTFSAPLNGPNIPNSINMMNISGNGSFTSTNPYSTHCYEGPISFNISEGHSIMLLNGGKEIHLGTGIYSFELISEIIKTGGLKPLLSLLDNIDFAANKVNVKNLEKVLTNKEKLTKAIQAGIIKATDEQISKLATIENDTYTNLHKLYLVWNYEQSGNVDNNNNSSSFNITMLPKELQKMIFSYIPLTGKNSIRADLSGELVEENPIAAPEPYSTEIDEVSNNQDPNLTVQGAVPGFDVNYNE